MSISKKQVLLGGLAFLFGVFWLFAIRFMLVEKNETHYHANFAVFIDGQRMPLDNFTLYEEVASCFGGTESRPEDRVHMHDQVNHVVHVHDPASTWGHLFANLGMTLGDKVFNYDKVIYIEDEDTQIRFWLNGEEVETAANRVIGNEDVMLITVGNPTDEEIQDQYSQITQDAGEYNERTDPSSCSGGKPLSFMDRVKAGLGINLD